MSDASLTDPNTTPATAPAEAPFHELTIALALGAAAALAYLSALQLGFFSDDFYFLGRNAAIIQRPLFIFHIFYRDFIPVVHGSFLLDRLIAHDWAPLFHASSITIHLVTTTLLFLVGRRLGLSRVAAGAGTLLWALDPHISEAVIWTAARGHSLATLFLLACFLAIGPRHRLWLGAVCAIVALGAKETALFPLILTPLLDRRRLVWWPAASLFAPLCVAFALFNLLAKPHLHLARATVAEFLLQGPFLMLRPLGLDGLYDFSPLGAAVVYGAFLGLALAVFTRPAGRVGAGWIVLSLVPIVVQPVYSSRYFYLFSVGYALLLGALVDLLRARLQSTGGRRTVGAAGAGLTLVILVANLISIQREIADYRILTDAYVRTAELLREPLLALGEGDSLIILDLGPRRTVAELNATISRRGNLEKLIPFRPEAVDGTVDPVQWANAIRPIREDQLVFRAELSHRAPTSWYVFDGRHLESLPEPPRKLPALDRLIAVACGPADEYFARLPEKRSTRPEYNLRDGGL